MKSMIAVTMFFCFSCLSVTAYSPITQDKTPTAPLANPVPASVNSRYISGFGADDAFTVFFEDRDDSSRIKFVSTTTGPAGLSAAATVTDVTDTHFCVKDWPINVGGTDYLYRAWASVGNNADHHFYVSNNLTNWVLISTFQIANAAGFAGARGNAFYGFHDVVLLNGTYYGWVEANTGQTMMARSATGDDVWEAFASVGGNLAADGPLQGAVPFTPTGSFYPLPNNGGYGKLQIPGDNSAWYLAINTAAQANLAPAALEAAFINPANWTWHDGLTGLPVSPLIEENSEHDLREAWIVGSPDPNAASTVIYTADFGAADGGKSLGHAVLQTTAQLVFVTQPGSGLVNGALPGPITVQAQTAEGGKATGYSGTVLIALLNNPGGAVLSGTTSANIVNGKAVTFSDLSLDKAGSGYTLILLSQDLPWQSSAAFTVNNPVPTLSKVSPDLVGTGGDSVALEVTGTNFTSDSTAEWNGAARPTLVVSDTVLMMILFSDDLAEPGSGTVAVTNAAPGGGTTAPITVSLSGASVSSAPVVNSVSANPNPGAVGQSITFVADGSAAGGQALTYAWDFADGTTGTGATATHAYTMAGVYTVTVTLTNAALESTSAQLSLTVTGALPLSISKKRIKANIPSRGTDKLILIGTFTLPEGTASLAGDATLSAGTFAQVFALNDKGKGRVGTGIVKIRAKLRNGVLKSRVAKFRAKLVGDFVAVMERAGLAAGETGNVTLPIAFSLLNQTYVADATFAVTSNGKRAMGK